MCPGLTHPAGYLDTDFKAGDLVAVFAEGKESCMAVGKALMSRDAMYFSSSMRLVVVLVALLNNSFFPNAVGRITRAMALRPFTSSGTASSTFLKSNKLMRNA